MTKAKTHQNELERLAALESRAEIGGGPALQSSQSLQFVLMSFGFCHVSPSFIKIRMNWYTVY